MTKYKFDVEHDYDDDDRDDWDDHDDHDDDNKTQQQVNVETTVVNEINNQVVVNDVVTNQVVVNEVVTNEVVINEVSIGNVVEVDTVTEVQDPITNYIYGTNRRDYLQGTEQDDVIYGYKKRDVLIDGGGSDRLYGGKGKNTYTMSADNQLDVCYIKVDKKVDIITNLGIEDRIDILGKKISFDRIDGGIGIYSKHRLQAIYTGDFSLNRIESITI